jgi:hypothetical protein
LAVVLVMLQLSRGGTGATRSAAAAAQPVPTRSDYSDPRDYGAAMTRLALTSSRTQIDGDIACDESSTWAHWACSAKGKPSLGAYAGVWLTYRCSPSGTAPPGAAPESVMINCTPQQQPATS